MDSHRTGCARRRFGDGRTWCLVHRCPALRPEAHRSAGILVVPVSPTKVGAPDLTILVPGYPTIEPAHDLTIEGWRQAGMVPQSVHENEEEPMPQNELNRFQRDLLGRTA